MRLSFLLVLTILLVGCSTAGKPISYDNTNIRLERIERNIIKKNKEIEDIKYSLETLSNKIDQISNLSQGANTVDLQDIEGSANDADLSNSSSEGGDKIIRVPISEKEVQIALKNAGYYDGAIDGKLGRKSVNAIKEFQKDFNLKVDGIVGRQTWNEMKKYLQ